MVIPGALIFFFISTYPEPPLKNASKGSTSRFCITTVPSNVIEGISSLPVICGNITYWLQVTVRYGRPLYVSTLKLFCCGNCTSWVWNPLRSGILPSSLVNCTRVYTLYVRSIGSCSCTRCLLALTLINKSAPEILLPAVRICGSSEYPPPLLPRWLC